MARVPLRHRTGPKCSGPMSCRIERVDTGEECVVLCVSGRIRVEDVDILRDLLGREQGKVAIDLKDVLLVSGEAVELLAHSEARGTELRNCPAYIREWITRQSTQSRAELSNVKTRRKEDIEGVR